MGKLAGGAALPAPALLALRRHWTGQRVCSSSAPGCAPLRRADIDFCFRGKASVEEVYAELERSGGQWGIDTIGQMSK